MAALAAVSDSRAAFPARRQGNDGRVDRPAASLVGPKRKASGTRAGRLARGSAGRAPARPAFAAEAAIRLKYSGESAPIPCPAQGSELPTAIEARRPGWRGKRIQS